MFFDATQTDVSQPSNFHEARTESVSMGAETAASESTNIPTIAGPELSLDTQANLLRGLIHEFKSLTDRACHTAMREAQHSAHVEEMAGAELTSLQLQLKERNETIDTRDREWRERNAIAQEKIDSLETNLRDKETQLENCHTRSSALLGEIDGLNLRLNEAATAMKQAETRFRDFAEHQESKINELRDEVTAKEGLLQQKEVSLRQLDEQSCLAICALERLLQTASANLEAKEAELREKETALQAVAAREQALGELLQQLTAESQKLISELKEKNQVVSELESKTYFAADTGMAWHNGIAMQERLL